MTRKTGRSRRLTAVFLLLLLVLWTISGFYRSRYGLTVNRWEVSLPRLTEPVRLAVLADLHDVRLDKQVLALTEQVLSEEPDLILMLGDMLNADSPDGTRLTVLTEQLSSAAPVYFAWGNHELAYLAAGTSPLEEELTAAGAVVLDRKYLDLTVGRAELRLGGLYDYAFARDDHNTCDREHMDPEVYAFLTEFQDTDRCRIMLSHRPDSFIFGEAAATWGVELVVAGHLHGGQVVLPLLGGVFGGDQGLFPEYVHGLYEKDSIRLAVTSGLGSQPGRFPRFRNPPELMILDLVPET